DLDPDRLDPHANTKNILVIVAVPFLVSYVEEFLEYFQLVSNPDRLHWIKLVFSPAFSICVMLGVVATFTTFLGTKPWPTRIAVVSALVALVAVAGMLDYEVEVRELHRWYPSAAEQIRLHLGPEATAPPSHEEVADLVNFQRRTPDGTHDKSWK